MVTDDLLRSHSGIRITPLTPLRVLPQRELYRPGRALQFEVLGQRAPTELHKDVFPSDRVRRAMLDMSGCQPAGELTVHPDVVVRHHVAHPHLGNNGETAFVDRTDPGMDMGVDEPRSHMLISGIDLHRTPGGVEIRTYRHHLPRLYQEISVLHLSQRTLAPHGGIAHHHGSRLLGDRAPPELHHGSDKRQVDLGNIHSHRAACGSLVRLCAGPAERRV